jgi:hypothetical protein
MSYVVNRAHRAEQPTQGTGDRVLRPAGYTPAAPSNPVMVPLRVLGEEQENFPLELDFVLPEQFFCKSRAHESGERLLLAAVLEDAITCYQRFLFASGQRQRRLFQEAECWIMERARAPEREDLCPYFSFDRVCDVLGLDADGVRDRLAMWRENQLRAARVSTTARKPWREAPASLPRARRRKLNRPQAA